MEILSDSTFRGEVNFNKNVTFVNGAALKFEYNGSFDGGSLVASEFVYPNCQGKLRMVDGVTGKTVDTYYFPRSFDVSETNQKDLALIGQIGEVASKCGFIKAGCSAGCVFSHKEYTLSSAIAADCTLFSLNMSSFGSAGKAYVADVELYKKEQITDSGSSVEVLSKVNADILLGQNKIYIRKASTYPIEANTHVIKLIGKISGTY